MSILVCCLYLFNHVSSSLFFGKGKSSDGSGLTYYYVHALASELWRNICSIIVPFHTLTGSDFKDPFYNQSKIAIFKRLLINPPFRQNLSHLSTDYVDVTRFILYIVYKRPLRESAPGESQYIMLIKKNKIASHIHQVKYYYQTRNLWIWKF